MLDAAHAPGWSGQQRRPAVMLPAPAPGLSELAADPTLQRRSEEPHRLARGPSRAADARQARQMGPNVPQVVRSASRTPPGW